MNAHFDGINRFAGAWRFWTVRAGWQHIRVRRWRRTPVAAWAAFVVLASIALPGLGRPAESPPNKSALDSGHSEKSATSQGAAVLPESDRFARRVREAIVRGRTFLVGLQKADGSFFDYDAPIESTVIIPTSDAGVPKVMEINVRATPAYPLATTSLAVLALLDSGMTHDDPVIVKSLDFLRSSPEPRLSIRTYENSLTVVALVAARQWDRDRARIAAIARSLEDHQIRKGAHAGMWNATRRDVPGDEDNSNTRYAVWGLYEAAVAGAPIKRKTWERAAEHFVKYQNHDGGWGTRNSAPSTGSMTCAGVASLFLCDQMLARTQRADAARVPPGGDEQASARDRAIKQGIDWLSRYFTVGINPGEGSGGFLHYINGLARIGRLSGRQFLGKHDWYREEAASLLDGQSLRDGSWQGMGAEADKPIATSLALLFLCEHK
jgi:hypothetical protein